MGKNANSLIDLWPEGSERSSLVTRLKKALFKGEKFDHKKQGLRGAAVVCERRSGLLEGKKKARQK